MKSYINDIINNAYLKHDLIQMPNEITKFSEFYYGLRCKNILEVGSYLGGTFYLLCKFSHAEGHKISIDYPFYEDQIKQMEEKNVVNKMKSFAEKVTIIHEDSHSQIAIDRLNNTLKGEKLDFLFIDGDHSYEGVKQDFEMYSPFVKKGGYVALHDINGKPLHGLNIHVHDFWNELPKENTITFNSEGFSMGIGVIQIL